MSAAFQGSPAVKQSLLARFDAPAEDAARSLPMLAALTQGSTGYPDALVRFLDQLIRDIANSHADGRQAARGFARRYMEEVAPGADLDAIAGQLMAHMLREIDVRTDLGSAAPALHVLLLRLVALHTQHADDGDARRREWATIRSEAMALTDAAETPVLKRAGEAVEAAAWDLTTSSGILLDVLKAFQAIVQHHAAAAWGWTADDERRANDLLQAIHAETQPLRDAGKDASIPALFRAREPALSGRHDRQLIIRTQARYEGCLSLTHVALDLLAKAPLALAEGAEA